MAMNDKRGYRSGLVDLRLGEVSREIFVNEHIYAEEQERIFARAWLHVGHESQIPKPGDYFVSSMGEESVILCRDRANRIHVFLNSCRHRGMKVCRYDQGTTAVFTCPYHGWSYGTDGRLVGVPYFREAYHSRLDKEKWGLVEVAQLHNYKGSIWATWDPAAPSFPEYLGDFTRYLDLQLDGWDGREGQAEVLGGIQKWLVPCNWKFPAENFSGDTYHNISHRSVDLAGIGPSGAGRRDMGERDVEPQAACLHSRSRPPDDPLRPAGRQVAAARLSECADRRRVFPPLRGGEAAAAWRGGAAGRRARRDLPQHRAALAPAAHDGGVAPARRPPDRMLALVLRRSRAPSEVKNFLRDYYIRYSGPAGMTEQDDMENWNYAHAASRGTIARRYPYNYEQGKRHRRHELRIPGPACARRGDRPHRGAVERAADAQPLPPLGGVHGGRRLGAARDLARRRAKGSRMRLAA